MPSKRLCSKCKCPLTLLRTIGKRVEERFKCARCCEASPEPTLTFGLAVRSALRARLPEQAAPGVRRPRIVSPAKE